MPSGKSPLAAASISGRPARMMDLERAGGRQPRRFSGLLRLSNYNRIHFNCGYPVTDRHYASTRCLYYDMLTLTDGIHAARGRSESRMYGDGPHRRRDGAEELESRPHMFTNINFVPAGHDCRCWTGAMAARRGQVFISPFTLAGAMAPVTIAGAVTQQNAEGCRRRAAAGSRRRASFMRVYKQCRYEDRRATARPNMLDAGRDDGAALWPAGARPTPMPATRPTPAG